MFSEVEHKQYQLVIGKQFGFEKEQDNLIGYSEQFVGGFDDTEAFEELIEQFNSIESAQDTSTELDGLVEFSNTELDELVEYIVKYLMFAYNHLVVDINIFDQQSFIDSLVEV